MMTHRPRVLRPWKQWYNRILGERVSDAADFAISPGVEENIRLVSLVTDLRFAEVEPLQPRAMAEISTPAVGGSFGTVFLTPSRGLYMDAFFFNEGTAASKFVIIETNLLPTNLVAGGTITRREITTLPTRASIRSGTTLTAVLGFQMPTTAFLTFTGGQVYVPPTKTLVLQSEAVASACNISILWREVIEPEG